MNELIHEFHDNLSEQHTRSLQYLLLLTFDILFTCMSGADKSRMWCVELVQCQWCMSNSKKCHYVSQKELGERALRELKRTGRELRERESLKILPGKMNIESCKQTCVGLTHRHRYRYGHRDFFSPWWSPKNHSIKWKNTFETKSTNYTCELQ